jgi:hypothetical protein
MDERAERIHLETGQPVNIDDSIAALMHCAAQLIAMYDEAKLRKFVMKRAQDQLAKMVREARETGVYPGGPNAEYFEQSRH